MRRGVRVGVDVGTVRIGVARSDPDGILATPVDTLQRTPQDDATERVAAIVADLGAIEVVVGLPRSLDGRQRAAAGAATAWSRRLARRLEVPVRMVDERFTSTSAHRAMTAAGRPGRAQRAVVDQVAAVIILQAALDQERSGGEPSGRIVAATDGGNVS